LPTFSEIITLSAWFCTSAARPAIGVEVAYRQVLHHHAVDGVRSLGGASHRARTSPPYYAVDFAACVRQELGSHQIEVGSRR
jgi:hypothetical protein